MFTHVRTNHMSSTRTTSTVSWPLTRLFHGFSVCFFPTEVHPLQTFLLWQRSPRKLRLGIGRCDEEFVFPWVCPWIWRGNFYKLHGSCCIIFIFILYHVISYYITSFHVVWYKNKIYNIISYYIYTHIYYLISYHILNHILWYHIMSATFPNDMGIVTSHHMCFDHV